MISVQCNTEFMHCMNEIRTVKMKTIVHDDDNDKILFLTFLFGRGWRLGKGHSNLFPPLVRWSLSPVLQLV